MQQDVLTPDDREYVFVIAAKRERLGNRGNKRRVLEIGPVDVVKIHEPLERQRRGRFIHLAGIHFQIVNEDLEDVRRHVL